MSGRLFAVNMRLLLAPRWVRWLVLIALMTAIAGPLWVLLMPDDGSDWKVRAVQVPVLSIGVGTLLIVVQERFRRSFLAALDGLDATQRRQAIEASQRGDAPTDPPVLSAAVRLCTLLVGSTLRTPRWARRLMQWGTALWLVTAIVYFLDHEARQGTIWLGLSTFIAVIMWWDSHRLYRLQNRLEVLRTAAASTLGSVPAVAEHDYPRTMPSLKAWLITIGALLVTAIVTGFWSFTIDPRRDCSVAREAIATIVDHRDLANSQSILPGGPSLTVYEEWSGQLRRRASRISKTDVAPRVQRIADLADQVVSLARQSRETLGTPAGQVRNQTAYQTLIHQMLDESEAILKTCHK